MIFKEFKDKKIFVYLLITFIISIGVILTPLDCHASEQSINDEIFNDVVEHLFNIPSWGWKLMDISLTNANDSGSLVKVPLEKEKDYDKINNTIDKLVKFFRLYEYPEGDGTSGSHGGGGHFREPSHLVINEDPIILNTEPKVTVDPIIKNTYNYTTNNYDYSVYNPTTNNFEIINNTYYNYDYDITIFQTDNYYIYYNYDITNYFITVAPISDFTNALYYVQFYELPDGRNSFNLKPNDLKGVIFNYDVLNYNITSSTDDIEVLGLYHLDGNYINSLDPSLPRLYNTKGQFVDGYFNGGFTMGTHNTPFSLTYKSTNNRYKMVSFWLYSPTVLSSLSNDVNIQDLGSTYYMYNHDIFLTGGWHFIQFLYDTSNGNKKISIDGGAFNSASDYQLFINNFIIIGNNTITFYPMYVSSVGAKTVNGKLAYPYFMYRYIIDEVLIYTWNDNIEFPFVLSEIMYQPFDYPFAYTIPDITSTIYSFEDTYYTYTPNILVSSDGGRFGIYQGNNEYLYYDTTIINDLTQPLGFYRQFSFETYGLPYADLLYFEFMNAYLGDNDFYYFQENYGESLRNEYGDETILKFVYTVNLYYNNDGSAKGFIPNVDIYLVNDSNQITHVNSIYPTCLIEFTDVDSFEMYIYMEDYEFYELKTSILTKDLCIAIQSPVPLNNTQIGGIRPFKPFDGDCFLALFENRVTSCQVYYGGVWHDVGGAIFYKGLWYDVKFYDFSNLMLVEDDSNSNGGTTIINYYGSYSDNINIIGSGNVSIDVDTTYFDKQSFTNVLTSIPKIFLTLGNTLLGMLSFLPTWLTVFIGTIFSCFVSLLIYLLVRRS